MIEKPRAARSEELPEVIRLANEVFLSWRGSPPIMENLFPQLFNNRNLGNLRVIVKDGKPVSHVGVWNGDLLIHGSWFKVGMVGCVCTRPDYRGRGYASALVEDAFIKMRKDGVDLVLVSGFRSLYKRAGCVEAGKVHIYHVPSGKMRSREENLRITEYEEGHISDLIEIYQREPLRYRRSLEDFRLLAERGFRCSDIPLKIYLAMTRFGPVAYVAMALFPWEEVLRIVEYAGPRSVILHLIGNVFRIKEVDSVVLTVPFHDVELLHLLEGQGIEKPLSEAQASMAIINPCSFFEKAKLYLEERIGEGRLSKIVLDEDAEKMRWTLDGEKVNLEDSRLLTLLFFGSPEKLKNPPQPKLELNQTRFLSNAVPLPTPVYGLNYI